MNCSSLNICIDFGIYVLQQLQVIVNTYIYIYIYSPVEIVINYLWNSAPTDEKHILMIIQEIGRELQFSLDDNID